jgi:hypothetical protein
VCVITLGFVVFLIKRTPLCLEVEDVEISILGHQMDKSCLQVTHTMGEGAIFTIVTLVNVLPEMSAELSLILLHMVQPFHPVVSIWAIILKRTSISLSLITQISLTLSQFSALIFYSVVKPTMLVVVLIRKVAGINLELIQVQMLDNITPSINILERLNNFKYAIGVTLMGF